jgi:Uri superfamily endonuclease
MPDRASPGTYALVLRSRAKRSVPIGRWGRLVMRRGYYVYVGSALGPGGVTARVSRHCRTGKPRHWHIDYLREFAEVVSVWFHHSECRDEHRWAGVLAGLDAATPVRGFGCSDCGCESHLFFFARQPSLARFAEVLDGPVEVGSCRDVGSPGGGRQSGR